MNEAAEAAVITAPAMVYGLCGALIAIAGYVVKLHAFDRKDRKELNADMMSVVKANTEAFHELKSAVRENTTATSAMHRMVTDHMRSPH